MEPKIIHYPLGDNPPKSELYYGIDVREGLRLLPDQSVQCVVTSPPYWGLRDYGTDPSVWGGDPQCDHAWEDMDVIRKGSTHGRDDLGSTLVSVGGEKTLSPGLQNDHGETKQYRTDSFSSCQKCGAWRGQLGLEPTPAMFVDHLVEVFSEVWRVLRNDGVLWLNIGDCYARAGGDRIGGKGGGRHWDEREKQFDNAANRYAKDIGMKPKDLVGIPWILALALRDSGWYLREAVIWHKPNCLPEPTRDRCTKAYEYVFLLAKSSYYFFDWVAIAEPTKEIVPEDRKVSGSYCEDRGRTDIGRHRSGGFVTSEIRNRRNVWSISTKPYRGAHFAVMPEKLAEICIKSGVSEKGCCPQCSAPFKRIMEKIGETTYSRMKENSWKEMNEESLKRGMTPKCAGQTRTPSGDVPHFGSAAHLMTGWKPSCECGVSEPIRCTVLDPFSGSATVGDVANRLGHNYIGIDLNPEYLGLATSRLRNEKPPDKAEDPEELTGGIFDLFGNESEEEE